MNTGYYMLDANGEPKAVDITDKDTLELWGNWYQKADNKVVKQERIGEFIVSTVFLTVDHRFGFRGPPILWETMIFDGNREMVDYERCAGSREQAEMMHQEMIKKLQKTDYSKS